MNVRPHRLVVRTRDFHSRNRSSTLRGVTFYVVVMLLCLLCLNHQDIKIKKEDLVKQSKSKKFVNEWKPIDFYLIYQMWTDKDLIELRKQIERDAKVYR